MKKKGLLHVHSEYSFDGQIKLTELATLARKEEVDFICLTEHSRDLSVSRYGELCLQARELSNTDFLIVPGVEVQTRFNTEVLGFGVEEMVTAFEISDVIDEIHARNGVAVLSHPVVYNPDLLIMLEHALNGLDGIEVWNLVYDGPKWPGPDNMRLLKRFKSRGLDPFCFCGLNLHALDDPSTLLCEIEVNALTVKDIVRGMTRGLFSLRRGRFKLEADGSMGFMDRLLMSVFGRVRRMRREEARVTEER